MGTHDHDGTRGKHGDEGPTDATPDCAHLLVFTLIRRCRLPLVACPFHVHARVFVLLEQTPQPHRDQQGEKAGDPELNVLCHPLEKPQAAIPLRLLLTPAPFVVLTKATGLL